MMRNSKYLWMAAVGLAAVAILIIGWRVYSPKHSLVLTGENGRTYLTLPVRDKEEFFVEFVHSVNKSPVIDYYRVVDGDIYVIATKYHGFGAGVQTELEGNEKLEYTGDGGMMVTGFHRKMEDLSYVVAMVSDHVLHYRGQSISLREKCGKGALVNFTIR